MLKSRAITVSFRFYFTFAVVAIAGSIAAAVASSDDPPIDLVIGPLSVGWKGGVGDHLAYTVWLGLAVVCGFLGILLTAFRDADPSAEAQILGLETAPLTRAPVGTNYWPVIGAFGAVTVLMGLALSSRPLAFAGAVVLAATAGMWTIRAWAERATGDDRANVELYEQLSEPLRLPILSLVLVAVMVIGFSRVLLALPNTKGSAAVFGIVAAIVFLVVTLIAVRPKLSRSVITLVLFVFGVLVVVGGIVGAIHGTRHFEHHEIPGQEQPAGEGG